MFECDLASLPFLGNALYPLYRETKGNERRKGGSHSSCISWRGYGDSMQTKEKCVVFFIYWFHEYHNFFFSLTLSSCPVLSCPVPPLFRPVLPDPIPSCPVLSCPALSCPILYPAPSCPALSFTLSHPVLPCPVLPVLSRSSADHSNGQI
jgi:hypothetical protein